MENKRLVTLDKLPKLLKHNYLFIDIRDPIQFKRLHIKKFINIPYDNFFKRPSIITKNKPIYLICYSGKRSLALANQLVSDGYDAYSFIGGFTALEHPINPNLY